MSLYAGGQPYLSFSLLFSSCLLQQPCFLAFPNCEVKEFIHDYLSFRLVCDSVGWMHLAQFEVSNTGELGWARCSFQRGFLAGWFGAEILMKFDGEIMDPIP